MDIKAKLPKGHSWKGNLLQREAEILNMYPVEEKELLMLDRTDLLLEELDREIKNKEIIKMQINAKPRLAKSTIGIALGMWIYERLVKYYPDLVYNKRGFDMENMARDEQEWSKKMRNPKRQFDIIVTDEKNKLEGGGENATTESSQREVFSDIQAGRYIHGIFICPYGEIDTNADIKLDIRNKQKGLVNARLLYRLMGEWSLLGMVHFDVSELIENWQRVEKVFYKWQETDNAELKKKLDEVARKDFYVEYMIKKFEKMDLMNKEGVLRPRELDYAEIHLKVIEKLETLAKYTPINQIRNLIRTAVEEEFRDAHIPFSMLGLNQSIERVHGVLLLFKIKHEWIKKQATYIDMQKKGKIGQEEYEKIMDEIMKVIMETNNAIEKTKKQMLRYIEINKRYNQVVER